MIMGTIIGLLILAGIQCIPKASNGASCMSGLQKNIKNLQDKK